MKVFLITAIAITILGAVFPRPVGAQTSPSAKHESPFACDRLALTPELRKRHFDELGPKLHSLTKAVRELPDGYEFEFPAESVVIQDVAEWAAGELNVDHHTHAVCRRREYHGRKRAEWFERDGESRQH